MKTVCITLIGKPGCHLCDDARDAIEGVRAELDGRGIPTMLDELNILEDVALARRHSEEIPVVRVNGKQHAIWRVRPEKLATAIEKAAGRREKD